MSSNRDGGARLAEYLFHQGTNYRAYEYFGAHRSREGGWTFRVFAPSADSVFLVGDHNGWQIGEPMKRINEGGIYECRADVSEGNRYKYVIRRAGRDIYKADPYAFFSECPPATASVCYDPDGFEWHDEGWLAYRKRRFSKDFYKNPINIYELHALSWKRRGDGGYLSWYELADELAPYVKQMGYTHVELMPIAEHPFDGSWGYQVSGYYSPTARLGDPRGFMAFVDKLHCCGIGVIIDWVPAHFPKDEHGLCEFDGSPLYEYGSWDKMEHKGWGTRRFDVGRTEVQSFLVSNSDYWARLFHVDGIRVDAVASMLYLDYDKAPGEWIPNCYGDNRCLEAEAFFKKLNGHMRGEFPDLMMIAEESTSWKNVTGDPEIGLGFHMKWDMGWMNDTLSYASLDPIYRRYHHEKLTFSMVYAFSERFVMPISHDEVVHGKGSLIGRMPGDYFMKFAGVRVFMAYMMTHPGKKLTFMGCEIGQFDEWNYGGEVQWYLLDHEKHAALQLYVSELNRFYLENTELWEDDASWKGFEWVNVDMSEDSVITYRRMSGDSILTVALNFTPVERSGFSLVLPEEGEYSEVFNSDSTRFGGGGGQNGGVFAAKGEDGLCRASVTLPPMSAVIIKKRTNV